MKVWRVRRIKTEHWPEKWIGQFYTRLCDAKRRAGRANYYEIVEFNVIEVAKLHK